MLSFRSTDVLGRIIEASFSKRKIDTRPPPFSLVPPINVENILFCFARLEDRHRKTIELSENYPGVVQRWKRDDKGKWKRIRSLAEENFDGKKLARLPSPRRIFAVSLSARLRERINAAPFLSSTFLIGIEDPLAFATICRELPGSLVSIVKFN